MSRAGIAVLKSQTEAIAARHGLSDDEVVKVLLDLALYHAPRAGIDGGMLHALIDDLRAQAAVEQATDHEGSKHE
jgi:hypothetical protein